MVALAVALLAAPAAEGKQQPRVTIVVLPQHVTVGQLAGVHGMGVGFLSAGIGDVPADQTYLDVGQGARVTESLYDGSLPRLRVTSGHGGTAKVPPPEWGAVRQRADSVPADIVPGLLGTTLEQAHVAVGAGSSAGSAALMLVDEHGALAGAGCHGACPIVSVESAKATGAGFNIGVDGTYLFTRQYGAGAFMRFTGGGADITRPDGTTLSLAAGGFQVVSAFRRTSSLRAQCLERTESRGSSRRHPARQQRDDEQRHRRQ